eukprot:13018792-Alexandrium_andersonii.AAC.1
MKRRRSSFAWAVICWRTVPGSRWSPHAMLRGARLPDILHPEESEARLPEADDLGPAEDEGSAGAAL